MRRSRSADPLPLLATLMALLLGGLALLQHRWLSAVSAAERARMKTSAAERARAFARDLDRELTLAFLMLGIDAEAAAGDLSAYTATYREWRVRAAYPDLVSDVWLVDAAGAGAPRLRRFDPIAARLLEEPAPPDLRALAGRLAAGGAKPGAPGGLDAVDAALPALVVATPLRTPLPPEARRASGHDRRMFLLRTHTAPVSWTVIRLDRSVLHGRVLPDLARRHASLGDAPEYHVAVSGPGDGGSPERLWHNTPGAAHPATGADASAPALAVRFDDIDAAILSRMATDVRGVGDGAGRPLEPPRRMIALRVAGPGRAEPSWRVDFFHRAGSVDAAVSAAQRKSGAVAGAVLLLLGGSAALIVLSARRARRLAARQMEFVAAVSHELRTPLTVIRSASDNLWDGLVADPARVREYGGVLREEGRRLSEMVEQVLAFAGTDGQEPVRRLVDIEGILRRAVVEAGLVEAGLEVQTAIESGLRVEGDEAGLTAALRNLLVNLRKYAGDGGLARIGARQDGAWVEVVVEDRGPGIPEPEVRRVFEPFMRGRRAADSAVPGSGIGLALVRRIAEAHGGQVEARRLPRGMAFILRLPGAAGGPAPAPVPAGYP
jgi:signal transduction histidine kinase